MPAVKIKRIHSSMTMTCCFFYKLQHCFPDHYFDPTVLPFQPFGLDLLHKLLVLPGAPNTHIALLPKEGIPSGAFTPLQPVGLWDPNPKPHEVENNFVEEIQDIDTAERRWPKGIALHGKAWGGVRRQQRPQIGLGFHDLWYEWTLLPTRETTSTKSPTCIPLLFYTCTATRTMTRCIY